MFSVKGLTSKRSWLVYNLFLTAINVPALTIHVSINSCLKSADSISHSNGNPSCVLNFKTTNNKNNNNNLLF